MAGKITKEEIGTTGIAIEVEENNTWVVKLKRAKATEPCSTAIIVKAEV